MNAKRVSAVLVVLALVSLAVACTGGKPELTATSAGRQPVTEIVPDRARRPAARVRLGQSGVCPTRCRCGPTAASPRRCSRTWSAANKTPAELAREIEQKLSAFVADPLVTVIVTDFVGPLTQQVRVVGEATEPQAIPFRDDMTMLDVMIAVGGLTEFAAGNRATLVRTAAGQEEQYLVRLDDLVRDGDISANVAMRPGDVVIIPESYF